MCINVTNNRWVYNCYNICWIYECYKIMFECVSVILWVHECLCLSGNKFLVFMFWVTDESANRTINNTIKYYWFDCGWGFNEIPRLDIIELIVTVYFLLYSLVMLHNSSTPVYKMAACIWVFTFTYVVLY